VVLAFAGYAAKHSLPRETALGVAEILLDGDPDVQDAENLPKAINDTYDRVRQGVQVKGYADLQVMLPAEELAQLRTLLRDVPKQSSESGRKRPTDHNGPDSPAAEASAGAESPEGGGSGKEEEEVILDARDPYPGAVEFQRRHFAAGPIRTLHHQAGVFYAHRDSSGNSRKVRCGQPRRPARRFSFRFSQPQPRWQTCWTRRGRLRT
jgi:hypothetical protein